MSSARFALLAALGLGVFSGCASDKTQRLEARLIKLESLVRNLEVRLSEMSSHEARLQALEGAPPPGPPPELLEELQLVQGQLAELKTEWGRQGRRIRVQPRPTGRTTEPRNPAIATPVEVVPAPPAETPLEVVNVRSRGLLVRSGEDLVPIELAGVLIPLAATELTPYPSLRQRFVEAFGAKAVANDDASEKAVERLRRLIGQDKVVLRYPPDGARVDNKTMRAYVTVVNEQGVITELNLALLRDGYALAEGEGDRAEEMAEAEAEAREAGRGLHRQP